MIKNVLVGRNEDGQEGIIRVIRWPMHVGHFEIIWACAEGG